MGERVQSGAAQATVSKWLPPLMSVTPPVDRQAFLDAIARAEALTGRLCVLPQDCRIEYVEPTYPPRSLRPRTSLARCMRMVPAP